MVNPLDIYQTMLDCVSEATLRGEFDRYFGCIRLPYTIYTQTSQFVLTETEQVRANFWSLSDQLRAEGVRDYIRLARTADYTNRYRITGTHCTNMVRNGERIVQPHAASMVLVSDGRGWRFSEARYAIANTVLPLGFPQLGGDPNLVPAPPERAFSPVFEHGPSHRA